MKWVSRYQGWSEAVAEKWLAGSVQLVEVNWNPTAQLDLT